MAGILQREPPSGDHHKDKEEDSSSDEDAHIYIRAEPDAGIYHWYLISNLEDISSSEFLTPVFYEDIDMDSEDASAIVPLGSRIYVIGGYKRIPYEEEEEEEEVVEDEDEFYTNAVYYMDTLCSHAGWTKAPPMLAERARPLAFDFHGNIYVMGGLRRPLAVDESALYAEVFYPGLQRWEAEAAFGLALPSNLACVEPVLHQFTATQTQLMVFGINYEEHHWYLYSYHFDTNKWDLLHRGRAGRWLTQIILDDIIFFYTFDWTIVGYDLNNPHLPPKTLKLSEEQRVMLPKLGYSAFHEDANFVHLGGSKLCLVVKEDFKEGYMLISFLKFTPSKVYSESGELVDLVASQMTKYTSRLKAHCINYCFAM